MLISDICYISNIQIILSSMQCPICCEQKPKLYHLTSKCDHRFCDDCCIGHIREKADRFTPIMCAFSNCPNKYEKQASEEIYSHLTQETKDKITAYEKYDQHNKNPNFRSCSQVNCEGKVNIKQTVRACDKCKTKHCHKCMKKFHDGACIADEHDRMMREAKNQRCPKCGIWVEKKEGCDYIDCKCGEKFCFKCGNPFSEDPCRKKAVWKDESVIRNLLSSVKLQWPRSDTDKLTKIKIFLLQSLKFLIKLPFLILLIIVGSVLFIAIHVIFAAIVLATSPILAFHLACDHANQTCHCFIFALLLWPLYSVLAIILILFGLICYPCLRNTYHHGLYDKADSSMNCYTQCFLKGIVGLLELCHCNYFDIKSEPDNAPKSGPIK